jgi:hypothetical protein
VNIVGRSPGVGREDCAPAAGKSTLNRLSRPEPTRYHKISHDIRSTRSWLS